MNLNLYYLIFSNFQKLNPEDRYKFLQQIRQTKNNIIEEENSLKQELNKKEEKEERKKAINEHKENKIRRYYHNLKIKEFLPQCIDTGKKIFQSKNINIKEKNMRNPIYKMVTGKGKVLTTKDFTVQENQYMEDILQEDDSKEDRKDNNNDSRMVEESKIEEGLEDIEVDRKLSKTEYKSPTSKNKIQNFDYDGDNQNESIVKRHKSKIEKADIYHVFF